MRIDRHVCQGCEHLDRCLESAKRVMKIRRSLKKISREMEEKTGILARDFARVVGVLEELGYLDDGSVTDSGDMLRKIYNECDLLIAEVVRAGVLHGMKAEELASLCSWFVYESRGDSEDSRRRREKREEEFPTESLYRAYLEVDRLRRDIESLESKKRARVLGTVDIGFGALCYAWARGDELGRLLDEFPEQSPGDMVRSVRQVIDLLRQLSDAVSEEALRSVLEEAIRATHRGVVAFDSLSDS